ncbi:hypothetical protein V1504DRAFT_500694 [Lipomyces starkeyi]
MRFLPVIPELDPDPDAMAPPDAVHTKKRYDIARNKYKSTKIHGGWAEHANLLDPAVTGVFDCTRHDEGVLSAIEQLHTWQSIYLKERTAKLRKLTGNYNWTVAIVSTLRLSARTRPLLLATAISANYLPMKNGKGSGISLTSLVRPGLTGHAYGIAWVQEFLARVEGHLLNVHANTTGANMTLDTNPLNFPVNQSLYLQFGHDADIIAAMTAFGLRQFAHYQNVVTNTRARTVPNNLSKSDSQ